MKFSILVFLLVSLNVLPGFSKPIIELEEEHKFDTTKSVSSQNGVQSTTTRPTEKTDKQNVKTEEKTQQEEFTTTKDDEHSLKGQETRDVLDLKTKDQTKSSLKTETKTEKKRKTARKFDTANQINDTVPLIDKHSEPPSENGIENGKLENSPSQSNTTGPTDSQDQSSSPRSQRISKSSQKDKDNHPNQSNTTVTDGPTATHNQTSPSRSREPSKIPEKDEENEAFCEELCSTCEGSERVFDIAEPSCFCKVTTVKSVKCLEEKVTEDVLMKVIAYVETNPKSEEEKLVAQYLKEREDFSINRNRRCCGHVGAVNPRQYENKGDTLTKEYNTREAGHPYGSQYVGLKQTDGDESFENDQEEIDQSEPNMLEAKKIPLDRTTANLWRKAMRAEETSSERHNPEEDNDDDDYYSEKKEEPKVSKKTKQSETRKLYKYEPSESYKSSLDEKLQEIRNKYAPKIEHEETNQNESPEITEKPKQSKRNKESENRKLYKYEPPKSYKPIVGEKLQEPNKKYAAKKEHENTDSPEITEQTKPDKKSKISLENYKSILDEKLQEIKNKYAKVDESSDKKESFVGNTRLVKPNKEVAADDDDGDSVSSKSLKSYKLKSTETRLKSTNDVDNTGVEKKWARTSPKSKKQSQIEEEADEKPQKSEVILSRKSIQDYLSDLKRRNSKPQDNIVDMDTKAEKTKFKSLDDLLYERELKRQQYLSSIRNKYAKPVEDSKPDSEPLKPISGREGLDKKKSEKNSKSSIFASKPINDPVEKRRGILSKSKALEDDEVSEEKINTKAVNKLKLLKEDIADRYQKVSKKLKSVPPIENDLDGSTDGKLPKKLQSRLLGKTQYGAKETSPIVSPFIDNNNKEEEKPIKMSSYKSSKDKIDGNIADLLKKLSSKYEPNDKSELTSKNYKFSTPSDKDYSDKDNELSGSSKNKQSLGSLISKIRALYDKDGPTDSLKRPEITREKTRTEGKMSDKKILGNPLEKYKNNAESKKGTNKNFVSRPARTKDYSGENENEDISEDPKGLLGEKNPSTFVYPEENERIPYLKRKTLKTRLNEDIVPGNQKSVDENLEEKRIVDKYLKAKYSGVKPSLIRDREESSPEKRKSLSFKSVQNKKDNKYLLDEINEKEDDSTKEHEESPKSKYLQKKQEFLERINGKEQERLRSKATLGKQKIMRDKNENTEPNASQEQGEYSERDASEEEEHSITKESPPSLKEKYKLNKSLGSPQSRTTMQPKYLRFDIASEQENSKKQTLKELLEQKKASKVGSIQMKSNEPRSTDVSEAKSVEDQQTPLSSTETPVKMTLKDKFDQWKLERLNAAPVKTPEPIKKQTVENPTNPIVSSQYKSYDGDMKAIMDQNPQKHCQHCMEYINHMTQIQKQQMLGQKPFNTRSISSNDGPNNVENKDESAQENFLNCRCYENQNGEVRDAIVGQPFNMQDVSNTFSNIKTGLESSVQQANDKISKGYNELKTNLQHQYEEASQKTFGENIKDASDKMSQKIADLHVKDTVVNGLSNAAHTVQDKYNSEIKEMSNTFNGLPDKVKSEYHHLTDGMVSQQPPPNLYTSAYQTPYLQAKYIDPRTNYQFQSSISGNA